MTGTPAEPFDDLSPAEYRRRLAVVLHAMESAAYAIYGPNTIQADDLAVIVEAIIEHWGCRAEYEAFGQRLERYRRG